MCDSRENFTILARHRLGGVCRHIFKGKKMTTSIVSTEAPARFSTAKYKENVAKGFRRWQDSLFIP